MVEYAVLVLRSARKEIERLESGAADRVVSRIERLAIKPRPPGCRKLVGAESLWRIRLGEYRILYTIDDARLIIEVVAVRHRRDAYR